MNRIKQIQKAWKQNNKIRKVPYWKTDWMNMNASSQCYEYLADLLEHKAGVKADLVMKILGEVES